VFEINTDFETIAGRDGAVKFVGELKSEGIVTLTILKVTINSKNNCEMRTHLIQIALQDLKPFIDGQITDCQETSFNVKVGVPKIYTGDLHFKLDGYTGGEKILINVSMIVSFQALGVEAEKLVTPLLRLHEES
jgi:hypothetical protein